MTLNLDIIGKRYEAEPFTYNTDDVILYALGIGAGLNELDFIYEKNLKVFPSFMFPMDIILKMYKDVGTTSMPIHGEQKIIAYKPLPAPGTIYPSLYIESIYDKGDKGAILNFVAEVKDETDQLIVKSLFTIIDRNAGNFGGDRGPKPEKFHPPDDKKPDFSITYATSENQAALYRLGGDKNPLHIDPEIAKKLGFDRPILHGMCTYGFAVRGILHSLCQNDLSRFKSFAARFMGAVIPGDTLIIEGWKIDKGKYIIQVKTQEGKVVLGNSLAEII